MLCDELLEKVGDCMHSGYIENASVGRKTVGSFPMASFPDSNSVTMSHHSYNNPRDPFMDDSRSVNTEFTSFTDPIGFNRPRSFIPSSNPLQRDRNDSLSYNKPELLVEQGPSIDYIEMDSIPFEDVPSREPQDSEYWGEKPSKENKMGNQYSQLWEERKEERIGLNIPTFRKLGERHQPFMLEAQGPEMTILRDNITSAKDDQPTMGFGSRDFKAKPNSSPSSSTSTTLPTPSGLGRGMMESKGGMEWKQETGASNRFDSMESTVPDATFARPQREARPFVPSSSSTSLPSSLIGKVQIASGEEILKEMQKKSSEPVVSNVHANSFTPSGLRPPRSDSPSYHFVAQSSVKPLSPPPSSSSSQQQQQQQQQSSSFYQESGRHTSHGYEEPREPVFSQKRSTEPFYPSQSPQPSFIPSGSLYANQSMPISTSDGSSHSSSAFSATPSVRSWDSHSMKSDTSSRSSNSSITLPSVSIKSDDCELTHPPFNPLVTTYNYCGVLNRGNLSCPLYQNDLLSFNQGVRISLGHNSDVVEYILAFYYNELIIALQKNGLHVDGYFMNAHGFFIVVPPGSPDVDMQAVLRQVAEKHLSGVMKTQRIRLPLDDEHYLNYLRYVIENSHG